MTERTAAIRRTASPGALGAGAGAAAEFERLYRKSGIAGANTRLRQLGDKQVVVVPVEPGCPRPGAPAVSGKGHLITTGISVSPNGSVTVKARGIPAGDILVIGVQTSGRTSMSGGILASPPPGDRHRRAPFRIPVSSRSGGARVA